MANEKLPKDAANALELAEQKLNVTRQILAELSSLHRGSDIVKISSNPSDWTQAERDAALKSEAALPNPSGAPIKDSVKKRGSQSRSSRKLS